MALGEHSATVGARDFLVWIAIASMVAGAVLLPSDSRLSHVVGALATSVIPAVLLGLHAQRAQLRSTLMGVYVGTAFVWLRRAMVVAALALAAAHGYQFALAWERAVLS